MEEFIWLGWKSQLGEFRGRWLRTFTWNIEIQYGEQKYKKLLDQMKMGIREFWGRWMHTE